MKWTVSIFWVYLLILLFCLASVFSSPSLIRRAHPQCVGAALFVPCGDQAKPKGRGETSLAELRKDYDFFNSGWFAGDLPDDTEIIFSTPPPEVTHDIVQAITIWDAAHERYVIWIVPKWNPSLSTGRLSLMHEMCHIQTWAERVDHGPQWQSCMENIALHDGFMGIW